MVIIQIVNLIPKGQFQAKQPNAVSGNFAKFGDENNVWTNN